MSDMLDRAARALENISCSAPEGLRYFETDARAVLQAALDNEDAALVDHVARAIYAVELARDENANSLIIRIGGNPHPTTRIETYEESAEEWREYARAAIRSMRFGQLPAFPPQAIADVSAKDGGQ